MTVNLAIAQLLLSACLVSVAFIWGIFRYRRGDFRRRDRYSKLQAYLLWAVGGLIGISTFYPLSILYTEHLWQESLGHADVFWGLQRIRWGFFLLCFLVAAGFMNINAAIANVLCPEPREFRRWTHTRTFSFHRTVVFYYNRTWSVDGDPDAPDERYRSPVSKSTRCRSRASR